MKFWNNIVTEDVQFIMDDGDPFEGRLSYPSHLIESIMDRSENHIRSEYKMERVLILFRNNLTLSCISGTGSYGDSAQVEIMAGRKTAFSDSLPAWFCELEEDPIGYLSYKEVNDYIKTVGEIVL